MSFGRLLRTVRPLTAEQLAFTGLRQLRHRLWARFPDAARAQIALAARDLPPPDPARPALGTIADRIVRLQAAVHPESVDDLRGGQLLRLGQELRVPSFERIAWRADLGEANSPLRRLTLAYFGWAVPLLATGRADDLERVDVALTSLAAMSWSEKGIFRDLWNPYTASHRLINLLAGLNLHGQAGGAHGAPAARRLLDHVRFSAAFVAADPERDLQANHLLKNWTALAVYAAATDDPPSVYPSLARTASTSLDQLVLRDGGHAERSPMYHTLGLLDVETLAASGALPTLKGRLDSSAALMRRALGVLTHPDGDIALFNDSWLGGAPSPRSLGISPPTPGPHALPETGYVRLDGSGDTAIFDCGACGLDQQPGHAHADFLSFELSVAGARFIVDPGTPTYSAGVLRDRCRSASTHNGPYFDGVEPLEFWKSFRVGRRPAAGGLAGEGLERAPLWCAGWQDGYGHQGAEPRRWLGLWPDEALLVIDAWTGAAAESVRSRFTIPHPWLPLTERGSLVFSGVRRLTCRAVYGTVQPPGETVWWPRYGNEEPATLVDIHPASCDGMAVSALLLSWGSPPDIEPAAIAGLAHALVRARRVTPAGFRG